MPVVRPLASTPFTLACCASSTTPSASITLPVGTVLNGGRGRAHFMSDVTRGVMPFMLAQFIVMFLLVAFPSIVMVPLRWLGGWIALATLFLAFGLASSIPTKEPSMTLLKTLLATALVAASLVSGAHAQDRTIKFAFQNQYPQDFPRPRARRSLPTWWRPRAAARSRSSCSPAARWAATCRPCRPLQGGTVENDGAERGHPVGADQGIRHLRLPLPVCLAAKKPMP